MFLYLLNQCFSYQSVYFRTSLDLAYLYVFSLDWIFFLKLSNFFMLCKKRKAQNFMEMEKMAQSYFGKKC